MNHPSKRASLPPFRPTVRGCVGSDPRLCAMLEACSSAALYTLCAHTYRSLLSEASSQALYELFEVLAAETLELLHALGRLHLAAGGNPVPRGQLRVPPHPVPLCEAGRGDAGSLRLCREAICDVKHLIDLCQTTMGRTSDRVARSFLAAILTDLERQVERLSQALAI